VVCDIEEVFTDIVSLGPKTMYTFTKESNHGLCVAYKNMLSMNIKRKQNRTNPMRPKITVVYNSFPKIRSLNSLSTPTNLYILLQFQP
jgi:hypothetical protein